MARQNSPLNGSSNGVNTGTTTGGTPLVDVRSLSKLYTLNSGLWNRILRKPPEILRAVDDVDLAIYPGEIFGLVGESGSGKTTLGRSLLRLIEPTSGEILYKGSDILKVPRSEMQRIRRQMQLIFQDPFSSLNPRMTVNQTLGEVLSVHKLRPPHQIQPRIQELLEMVGLPHDAGNRYPRHFSGGQRQRIGIARALAMEPEFIVADEPVSAVDVSIQAQVLNLLVELKQRLGLTMLFIAHDLSVVQYISTRVGVMYLGKIVEIAPRSTLFAAPKHPYTQGLLLAAPQPDPDRHTTRVALEGEPPSPLNPPPGCRFHTRCYLATDRCKEEVPRLEDIGGGHFVACHHHARSVWPPPGLQVSSATAAPVTA
jgi:oligopeptide/dipeptide ABC transporter ATP-binding protein